MRDTIVYRATLTPTDKNEEDWGEYLYTAMNVAPYPFLNETAAYLLEDPIPDLKTAIQNSFRNSKQKKIPERKNYIDYLLEYNVTREVNEEIFQNPLWVIELATNYSLKEDFDEDMRLLQQKGGIMKPLSFNVAKDFQNQIKNELNLNTPMGRVCIGVINKMTSGNKTKTHKRKMKKMKQKLIDIVYERVLGEVADEEAALVIEEAKEIEEVSNSLIDDVVNDIALEISYPIAYKMALQKVKEYELILQKNEIFECPITLEFMTDPVVASDGYTYERSNIVELIENGGKSPMTREKLKGHVYPNRFYKSILEAFPDLMALQPV